MLRAEVLKTVLYGCVTWSPHAYHYETLHRAHHRFLTASTGESILAPTTRFPIWTRFDEFTCRIVIYAKELASYIYMLLNKGLI